MPGKWRMAAMVALCAMAPLSWCVFSIDDRPDRRSGVGASKVDVNRAALKESRTSAPLIRPPSDTSSLNTDAEQLARIERHLSQRQYDRAFAELDASLRDGKFGPWAYAHAMQTAAELQNPLMAIRLYDAIAMDDPQYGRASRIAAAERCMADLRLFEAIERLKVVRQYAPVGDISADILLAKLYEVMGMRLEARAHLFSILQHGSISASQLVLLADRVVPSNVGDIATRAASRFQEDSRPRILQAYTLAMRSQWSEALRIVQPIARDHPDFLQAYILEGYLLLELDRLEDLVAWGQRPVSEKLQHPDYWLIVGKWSRRRDSPVTAVGAFAKACRLDPDHREGHTQLAQVLDQVGDERHGSECWERAVKLARLRELLNLWFINSQSGLATAPIGDQLVALGRYWEALAWYRLAERAKTEPVSDLPERIERLQPLLSRSRDRVDREAQPALRLRMEDYPQPRWTLPKSTAQPHQAAGSAPELVDIAVQTGLDFRYQTAPNSSAAGHWIWQTSGHGIAVTDVEPDGWPDLYVTQGGGTPLQRDAVVPNQLFRNIAGRYWKDDTSPAGVGDRGFGQGVASGDYNDDGFQDLLVANIGEIRLLRNNGDGTYRDVSEEVGLSGQSWATSVAIADLDGDTVADLFIGNYCDGPRPLTEPCFNPKLNVHRVCVPAIFAPQRDRLYRGTPEGQFVDVTEQWLGSPADGRALGLIVADLAPSPGLEVFVANDMSANQFWLPQREGDTSHNFCFKDAAGVRGLAVDARGREQACMGVAAGDPDHDGDLDLVVTNFFNESNNFYEQTRGGRFIDKAIEWGLAEPSLAMLGFGSQWVDLNLDGELELFIANGHIDDYSTPEKPVPFRMPAQLFAVVDDRLQPWPADQLGEYMAQPRLGRTVARLDWNRDGYPELAVGQIEERLSLLSIASTTRAAERPHWLAFELVATQSQRDAIGATVELRWADGRRRWSQLIAGDGFQCANQRQLLFGLAGETQLESVIVRWPSGQRQSFQPAEVDCIYLAIEGQPQLIPR
jgi:tetratricopeptide (TPR) repeat protein